jgi:hypothetical protein
MSVEDRKQEQQEALLQELARMPIVGTAVKEVGISRATYYRWREEDGDFEEKADLALAKGHETVNDVAESRLIAQITDGEQWAIKYWLGRHHYRYMGKPEAPLPFRRPPGRMNFFAQFWK